MNQQDNGVLYIDNPEKCGLGEGQTCCAFLTVRERFACGRTIPGIERVIRERLREGTIRAKGDPGDAPYPECQSAQGRLMDVQTPPVIVYVDRQQRRQTAASELDG